MRLTRTSSIVIAIVGFATLLAFQNCAPVGTSSQIETASVDDPVNGNDDGSNGGSTTTPPPTDDETPAPVVPVTPPNNDDEDMGPPDDFTGCNETNHPELDNNDRPVLLGWSTVSANDNAFNGFRTDSANTQLTIGMGNRRSGDSNAARIYLGIHRGNDPDVQNHTIRCQTNQTRNDGNDGALLDTDCGDQFTGNDRTHPSESLSFTQVQFDIQRARNLICMGGTATITITIRDQCSRNNTSSREIVVNVGAFDGCLAEEKLVQDNIQYANNNMGKDVDIDGRWIAVAAPEDDEADPGGNSGAVLVYKRNANNSANVDPASTQKLLPTGAGLNSARLQSVALSGNYLIAGAPAANTAVGAAWLYKKNGSDVWQAVTRIDPPTSAVGQRTLFGYDVAIDGNTFVVSAIRDGEQGAFAGAAYVYTIDTADDSISTPTKLTASDAKDRDYFGYSVAIENGNVVVGAPVAPEIIRSMNNDNTITPAEDGDGQVYHYAAGSYTETRLFPAGQSPNGSQLGYSVAIDGNRVVAGAPRDDGSSYDENSPTGAAFVVNISNLNSPSIQELDGSDGRFGEAVAISGTKVLVTALDFENGRGTGSLFGDVSSSLTDYFEVQARDQRDRDELGISAAIDEATGDYAVLGAWLDTVRQNNQNWDKAGSAYVVETNP